MHTNTSWENRVYHLRLLIALVILMAIGGLHAQQAGDYRTRYGGEFGNLALWQTYNGSAWVSAVSLPQSPFTKTLQIRHFLSLDRAFCITGRMQVTGQLHLIGTANLEIAQAATMDIGVVRLADYSMLVNNGSISSVYNRSSFVVERNATLVNNSLLRGVSNLDLTVNSGGKLVSGSLGKIAGNTDFSTNYSAIMEIANPQGIDGALETSGDISMNDTYFVFNGDTAQVTGMNMPETALGIVFDNSEGIRLSKNIKVSQEALLTEGSSLDLGDKLLDRAWYGAGSFVMQDNTKLITAHPDGLSSSQQTGSIRLGTRYYNSTSSYVYNGNTVQQTGDFVTVPASYTVNNLILSNPAGVTLTNPLNVVGTMEVLDGFVAYDELPTGIDGYYSPDVNRVVIDRIGVLMYDFEIKTQVYESDGDYISRNWVIKGNFNGNKRITLYWTAADDGNFEWSPQNRPEVYVSNQAEPLQSVWNSHNPREISFVVRNFPQNREDLYYRIGKGDETLPVTLSSFTASPSSQGKVILNWITQSESNTSGFNVYRASNDNLQAAMNLGVFVEATNSSQTQVYTVKDEGAVPGNTYYYWLEAVYYNGLREYFGPVHISLTNGEGQQNPIPVITGLSSIFPNPMSSSTRINYGLSKTGSYAIEVYNLRGQKLRVLANSTKERGNYSMEWDGRDDKGQSLPTGIYLIRAIIDGEVSSKRITIVN